MPTAPKKESLATAFNPTRVYHYPQPNPQQLEIYRFDLGNQWSYCPECKANYHKPQQPVCPVCKYFGLQSIKYPTFLFVVNNITFDTITKLAKEFPNTFIILARQANLS